MSKERKCFCDLNPFCYALSKQKEIWKRKAKDLCSRVKIAKKKSNEKLPVVVYDFHSNMIKRAPGVELQSQLNKAVNIRLACQRIIELLSPPEQEKKVKREKKEKK